MTRQIDPADVASKRLVHICELDIALGKYLDENGVYSENLQTEMSNRTAASIALGRTGDTERHTVQLQHAREVIDNLIKSGPADPREHIKKLVEVCRILLREHMAIDYSVLRRG